MFVLVSVLVGCAVEEQAGPQPASEQQSGRFEGELPCDSLVFDFYRVATDEGQRLEVVLDTLDAQTAFDPAFGVRSVTRWAEAPGAIEVEYELAWADDGFTCTAVPTSGECPRADVSLVDGASDHLRDDVLVFVSAENGACAGPDGGYSLELMVDGAPASAVYLGQAHLDDTLL